MKSKQMNEPLLYIDQPNFVKPQVKVQAKFQTETSPHDEKPAYITDCSIEERIHYLLHLATGIPSVKVEVITEKETYQGRLTKADHTKIYLQNFRRREITILKADITAIHLKSF